MKKIVLPILSVVGAITAVLPVYAATSNGQKLPNPINTTQDVLNLMCYIAVYFFYIMIIITVIMIVYAAFLYVTAGDSTEKTTKARKTITYAAVGVAVSLMAAGFPNIIAGMVAGNSSQTSLAPHCSLLGGPSN